MKSQLDLYGSAMSFLSTGTKTRVHMDKTALYYKAALFSTVSIPVNPYPMVAYIEGMLSTPLIPIPSFQVVAYIEGMLSTLLTPLTPIPWWHT